MAPFTQDVVIDAIEQYGQAWADQDVEKVLDVFTEDAMYLEKPSRFFEGQEAIGEMWQRNIVGKQFNVEFRQITEEMVFDSTNTSAVVKWECSWDRGQEDSGNRMHGLWCAILRFTEVVDQNDQMAEPVWKVCWFEEYWHNLKPQPKRDFNNNKGQGQMQNNRFSNNNKGNSKGNNNKGGNYSAVNNGAWKPRASTNDIRLVSNKNVQQSSKGSSFHNNTKGKGKGGGKPSLVHKPWVKRS